MNNLKTIKHFIYFLTSDGSGNAGFSDPGSGVGVRTSGYIRVASGSSEPFRVEPSQAPAFLKGFLDQAFRIFLTSDGLGGAGFQLQGQGYGVMISEYIQLAPGSSEPFRVEPNSGPLIRGPRVARPYFCFHPWG